MPLRHPIRQNFRQSNPVLPDAEQQQILKLLNEKIEALNLRGIQITNDLNKLQQYLTDYSFNLKQHFYG